MADVSDKAPEDHRVQSARRKRERMRAALLAAVLRAYPRGDPRTPTVIDDVIRDAQVSRGTFYKYFDSLEQAVEEVAGRLADELAEAYAAIYAGMTDPATRAATGFQLYLSRSLIDPSWGSFVAHLNYIERDTVLLRQIRADLQAGVDAGAFAIAEIDVALDLIIGSKVEGIRRLLRGSGSRAYVETLTAMMLRSLGVDGARADAAARDAGTLLREQGPELLPWWRSFD